MSAWVSFSLPQKAVIGIPPPEGSSSLSRETARTTPSPHPLGPAPLIQPDNVAVNREVGTAARTSELRGGGRQTGAEGKSQRVAAGRNGNSGRRAQNGGARAVIGVKADVSCAEDIEVRYPLFAGHCVWWFGLSERGEEYNLPIRLGDVTFQGCRRLLAISH